MAPAADREGLQPHVVWAALGVTIARGEEHTALWGHLGIEKPPRWWSEIPYSLDDLYPDALDCLERVRALGLRVGIVGNQTEALEAWARDAALPADVISSSASLGRPQARSRVLREGRRAHGLRRQTRSPTSAIGSTTTFSRPPPQGSSRCTFVAGPWGRLQPTPPEAALGLDDLATLPEALASLV